MTTKSILTIMIALLLLFVFGCGNDTPAEEPDTTAQVPSYAEAVIDEDTLVTSSVVSKTVEIAEGFSKEEIGPLLEQIAADLKEEHPDAKITVSAIQDGKDMGKVELEK